MSGLSAHSPHYSATKGAVIAFSKSVAAEVAGSNIYVNVMAPGLVHTQEVEAVLQKMGEEARNRFLQLVPSGRMGTPEEYAATVVHLAGEHYLVGQVISPNGGMNIPTASSKPNDGYLFGPRQAWFAFAMTIGLMLFDYIDRQVIVSLFPYMLKRA